MGYIVDGAQRAGSVLRDGRGPASGDYSCGLPKVQMDSVSYAVVVVSVGDAERLIDSA
jgi:hypothetical protein